MEQPTVETVMSRGVNMLGPNDSLEVANAMMTQRGIRHLVVVEEGSVVGVLSERDLFRAAVGRALGYGERDRSKLMEALVVREVMSQPAVTVVPEATLEVAGALMVARKVSCLPVVTDGTLVGMLTTTDLLRHAWVPIPRQPSTRVSAHFR